MKTKIALRTLLIPACFISLLLLSIIGCKTENRTLVRLPSGSTNALVSSKLDLVATNPVRLAPTGAIALRMEQEQPLRATGKIDVVLSTNPIRVVATNTIPLKLSADAPLNIQATNPFTLKIDTNNVIQARVTVSPVQVIVTNAVVNLTVPTPVGGGSNVAQIVIVSNILQQTLCCTNVDSRKRREDNEDSDVPRFSQAGGDTGWRWALPVLCILLGGGLGRMLGRYLGVIPALHLYDQHREAMKKWLAERISEPAPDLRDWLDSKPPRNRSDDFHALESILSARATPFPDVQARLALLKENLSVLPADRRKDLFVGLTAAALCPVFLSFSSGNLVVAAADNPFALFAFLGFCLLASMLGAEFITALLKGFRALIVLAEKKIAEGK